MHEPAPTKLGAEFEFQRPARWWPVVVAVITLLVGGGLYLWTQIRCGDCGPPIPCAQRCDHPQPPPKPPITLERELQPKTTDRAPQN